MRIVVLGAGTIGRVITLDLAQDVDHVVVADRDPAAAGRVAAEAARGVEAAAVDVTDAPDLRAALQGARACVNSVQYYFNLEVMRACLEAGVPYVDLGGLFHMTRRQLGLHSDYEHAGLTAILGLGSSPGVSNVQAGWLASLLESVGSVRIYNGSTLDEGDSLAAPYAIDTILDEISQPAVVYRDGAFVEAPALGEEEFYHFLEPIGWAKTHLSLHSEIATLPLSLAERGIRECTFKITFFGYSEAALRKLQFLAELGLAGREPVEVNGARVRPRDLLLRLLADLPQVQARPASAGFKDVATEVRGRAAGKDITLRADTSGWPHPEWKVSGGTHLVGAAPAIVARWLASGELSRPGVWAPEQIVPPERFFAELGQRGFTTRLTRTETVAGPG